MKAIAYHRYGSPDVLRCEEIERPVPGDGEVLIAVRAASVNPLDWHFLRLGSQSLVPFLARRSQEDLIILRDLMAAGKVTPVIDRSYNLDEVPEAIRYLEGGHARGKVVITV